MPPETYRVLDMHTAGEPVRIVTGGYPVLAGGTLLDKRRDARERFDHVRRILMLEPRGHAGMYGVIPLEPCSPHTQLAVLFMHNDGYSTMCGHATIAIGKWAVESGRVPLQHDGARFKLETPCGIVDVEVTARDGAVVDSSFLSVPAFASHFDARVRLKPFGEVTFDIAYGGAFYAILRSSQLGLPFWTTPLDRLVEAGTCITRAARQSIEIRHPAEPDLAFLYGTILTDDADAVCDDESYNLCIFAEGQIDRSPTGSGATARMALDYARGRIAIHRRRRFYGVSGLPFWADLAEAGGAGLDARVRVRVGGTSSVMGEATLVLQPEDSLREGFRLPASFGELPGRLQRQ